MEKEPINAIMVFNREVTKENYGSVYEEHSFGYGLDYDEKTKTTLRRNPELLDFVKELLRDFGAEAFDTESLLDDVGFHAVFIEGNRDFGSLDFQEIIERALSRGFYVGDETNASEIFVPQKRVRN